MSDSQLKITILGCGSSTGVPRINGDWGACDPNEPRNWRRRSSILLEKQGKTGTTTIVIDTGPDIREQFLSANVQSLDAIVYTHAHADHIHGIDDLRFFSIVQKKLLPVFMDLETSQRLRQAFDYCFQTPSGSGYPPIMEECRIISKQEFVISGAGGALPLIPIPLKHGRIDSLGFRFGDVAYTPDLNDIPKSSINYLKSLDLWIVDALRYRPHPSHFCLDDVLKWDGILQPKRVILTNMHSDIDYNKVARQLPKHITPAYDGLGIYMDNL
ncbi:MBL fold metallo-hydrolase [Flexibacterium corallicola]|uniref:MBL fold metallo-hydrolase n=1 Tax=Flexibacterium corallicola TaxID=3037259 RepID=UPI00286EE931|nr:MBL fold metallo-hydrolase [Pseudovibrio sp. M1P-2-3]